MILSAACGRSAAHQIRNDATAKKGGEPMPKKGAQSRTSMVAFRGTAFSWRLGQERSLSRDIGGKH
jgi:hypothetical protein